ncbi:hypothetical protein IHV25_08065 [Phaeovibrio sulfidiphilus]|uniref:Uncharacterized protein n=1 Tax=Phaeovibrio sulfidiphilus TaxID=1220600 RepID=A0A8J6YXQ1_9PROT|nr:hypothetical protein [Phaeovibrio sulfidiphilus]MBE1237602.1 hypothetical protein [Phaeovibrio sulfidiphilus]
MAVAAQRIVPASTGFANTANTRFGDGVRASSASVEFTPVTAAEGSRDISLRDQGLRNDNWGAWKQNQSAPVSPEIPARDGRVYVDTVFLCNADARTLFNAHLAQAEASAPPANDVFPRNLRFQRASDTYEKNARTLQAAFVGLHPAGFSAMRML